MAVQGEIFRGVASYIHPAGSVMQNVFTWELQDSDESDAACFTAIENWLDTVWVPNWKPIADSNVVLTLLEVDVLTTLGLVDRNIDSALQAHAGTVVGEAMPAAVAGFLQFRTERTKSLGRKYVPGISESRATEGLLDALALAAMLQLFNSTIQDIPVPVAGTLVAGVLSRVTNSFQENNGAGYYSDVPAYQRRRKPYVGS